MTGALSLELTRLAVWLGLCAVIGLFIRAELIALLVGTLSYLSWHLTHIVRLYRWLGRPSTDEIPEGSGIWADIYREFFRLEKLNQKSKHRLESIVSQFQASTAALPDGAVVLDASGRIAWFNDAARRLLGLRTPDDLGLPVVNLVRHPAFTRYFQEGKYDDDVEVPIGMRPQRLLALRLIPYGSDQRLLIARDISQQKRLEQMRRDFVANASHELRTPLTVLRGYLEMMAEEASAEGPLQSWATPLREMTSQASRMGNIIDDLLKLARIEASGRHTSQEVVAMRPLLEGLVADAVGLSRGVHSVVLNAEPGLDLVGHAGEMTSICSNLLNNARQYTPEGGDIRLRWWSDTRGAHFSVTDTGIGVEPTHIPRLTERFYRVDAGRSNRTGGTGLGLAIVKHALENHEGRLEVASEPNVGSTFTCHFPAARVRRRQAA